MNTEQTNLTNTKQQDVCTDERALSVSARFEMEAAYAEALLDQVEMSQRQIRDLQDDISLLQTAENALDLISQNLAKVRRLVMDKQNDSAGENAAAAMNHEIRNLLMVNMLIAEDTELNGHYLLRDGIIRMTSCANRELTLTTTRIPEIAGIDNNDTQATLDSLDIAARTINRQYKRIATLMRALLDHYQLLRSETNLLMNAQQNLKRTD
jgi:hypothetical protein